MIGLCWMVVYPLFVLEMVSCCFGSVCVVCRGLCDVPFVYVFQQCTVYSVQRIPPLFRPGANVRVFIEMGMEVFSVESSSELQDSRLRTNEFSWSCEMLVISILVESEDAFLALFTLIRTHFVVCIDRNKLKNVR